MAQPQAYNREVDFTERDGDDTNHPGINAELDAAALSINQIRDNLELIQKDDGSLQNGIVTGESLGPSAFEAIKGDLNEAVSDAQSAAAQSTLAANTSIAARDAALAAQAAAETANTSSALNATTANTKAAEANASAAAASASATASGNSATASQTSRLASEAARDLSQSAQAAAAASQTATATSEANASASAATATAQAGNATTQAGIATTQAASASASATAAAASLDSFDDRYLGPKSTAPTTDNDGNALLTGALYFDTTAAEMRVFTGSVWKAIGSAVNGTTNRASYTATAGQTTFGITYDVGFVDVYLNGLKLQATVDFTATNGTSIVLTTGATVGDVVDIVAYGVFTVANTYTKTEADALLAAKANQATTYTKTEVDAFAVKLTGAQAIAGAKTFSDNIAIGAPSVPSDCRLAVSGVAQVLHDPSGALLRFNKTLGTDTGWLSNRSYGWHNGNGLALSTQTADPLRFGTNGTLRLEIPADAAGIKFPATQAASSDANTLDDYEEGTWTPAIVTSGYTTSEAVGAYTKIGRLVTVQWSVMFSAVNAGNNSQVIHSGLPFPVVSIGSSTCQSGVVRENSNTGAMYMADVQGTGSTSFEMNSIDGVSANSQRTFRTGERYCGTVTYLTN